MTINSIMLVGDTHGDLSHWTYIIAQGERFGVDAYVQLGDFGFWEPFDDRYLHKLNRMVGKRKVYWIDGNHENHRTLRDNYTETDEDGFIIIRDNIRYIPRGHRWTWGNYTFLGIGGAYSVDKHKRIEGRSWWPEEMITEEDVEKCIAGGKVDIVLSHDSPGFIDIGTYMYMAQKPFSRIKGDDQTAVNRNLLAQVVWAVEPQYVFHGHWHLRYMDDRTHIKGRPVRVEGLDCNLTRGESWTIFHTT